MDSRSISKKLQFIEDYKNASNAATGSQYDSNANVTQRNIATLQCELGKKDLIDVNRAITKNYLLSMYGPEAVMEFEDDLKHHKIYSHDESSIMPYCCSISLYPFLLEGLKGLGGSSNVPKHANSFIGGLINLIFLVSGQFAGACLYKNQRINIKYNDTTYSPTIKEFVDYFDPQKNYPGKIEWKYTEVLPHIEVYEQGRWVKINNVFKRNYKDTIYKITTKSNREVLCSKDHKFRVLNKGVLEDIPAQSLQVGDTLIDTQPEFNINKNRDGYKLGQFIGIVANNGRVISENEFRIAINHEDNFTNAFVTGMIKKLCGKTPTRYEENHCCDLVVSGVEFVHCIQSFFTGHDTLTKSLDMSHTDSNEFLCGFVDGLIATSGVHESPFSYQTTNEGLIDNVINIIYNLVGERLEKEVCQDVKENGQQLYKVTIPSKYYKLFDLVSKCESVGNISEKSYGTDVIVSIELLENDDDYVYEIETESHYYSVGGYLTHNCAIPEFLTYFDHFLRVDYGNDYHKHLDDALESWGNRKATLRNRIEDLFQQFVYSTNQPAGARNYQSPFINIAYFDQYYFESIFKDFVFPDGDIPQWESTKELQKIFMKWFNKERLNEVLTFPVETSNILVQEYKYKDEEMADFFAEMWSEGHSFFMYQSDSVDALASCCRLRNEVEENVFSYTLGAGGIETGSKKVITLNLNRIVQDWHLLSLIEDIPLSDYIRSATKRVHRYLNAWNQKLWDDFNAGLLTVYNAGFIDLDKQFLTVGVNGFVEAAEFLKQLGDNVPERYKGIEISPYNEAYKQLARDILGTIKELNKESRTEHCRYNTEFVPAENAAVKLYEWDKKDGYVVPKGRNLYNSYFYVVEDSVNPIDKFYYQGSGFASECDGGVALHSNLDSYLSKHQYRMLMDVAVKAGCNYWTYNIPNTICNSCGHIDKSMLTKCSQCGSDDLDYATRVIGYLKRISNFSEARQEEASRRNYGKVEEENVK